MAGRGFRIWARAGRSGRWTAASCMRAKIFGTRSGDGGWCGVVAVGESAFAIQLSWAGAEDFEGDLLGHRPALSFVVEHRELEGQDERWKTVYSGTIYL